MVDAFTGSIFARSILRQNIYIKRAKGEAKNEATKNENKKQKQAHNPLQSAIESAQSKREFNYEWPTTPLLGGNVWVDGGFFFLLFLLLWSGALKCHQRMNRCLLLATIQPQNGLSKRGGWVDRREKGLGRGVIATGCHLRSRITDQCIGGFLWCFRLAAGFFVPLCFSFHFSSLSCGGMSWCWVFCCYFLLPWCSTEVQEWLVYCIHPTGWRAIRRLCGALSGHAEVIEFRCSTLTCTFGMKAIEPLTKAHRCTRNSQ